jgi:hypothetical protein
MRLRARQLGLLLIVFVDQQGIVKGYYLTAQ